MPSSYAHYRFGQAVLPALPAEVGKTVRRFRQLYDVGLHGPDLFFYYNPLMRTKIGALGRSFHAQSGQEFFGNAARLLWEAPTEGGTAYLYGVLAHYALDSACHPLIKSAAAEGKIGHSELETEFDRFLLDMDGKRPPCRQDLGEYIRLTRGESATVSGFYPPAGQAAIAAAVRHMRQVNHVLAGKNRKLLERMFRIAGPGPAQMVMPQRVNYRCSYLDEPLLALYEEAEERYPLLAEKLTACLKEKTLPGEEFAPAFG